MKVLILFVLMYSWDFFRAMTWAVLGKTSLVFMAAEFCCKDGQWLPYPWTCGHFHFGVILTRLLWNSLMAPGAPGFIPGRAITGGQCFMFAFRITADRFARDSSSSLSHQHESTSPFFYIPTHTWFYPISVFYLFGVCEIDLIVVFTWLSKVTNKVY